MEPSGKWTQTNADKNFGIRPAFEREVAEGQLSHAQLRALAQHLATQRFNALPERVGTDPAPDKRMVGVTVGFGKRSTTLDTERGSLTDGCPATEGARADEWARFVAVALVVRELVRESTPEPKAAEKAGPLTMRLVAKKDTYALDFGGKTPDEYRKRLKDAGPFVKDNVPLPPGPVVDLEVVITNTSDKPVTISVGGDDSPLGFDLKGPGAVSVVARLTTTELRTSRPVTIAPGKSFVHPVGRLASYPRETNLWYWTAAGEYTLTAQWNCGDPGAPQQGPPLRTEPIKLTIVSPDRVADYLKDGKLKARVEVQEVLLGGIADSHYSYFSVEPDGTWSVGTTERMGVGPPVGQATVTAKGKLTPGQLTELALVLARYDLLNLPPIHGDPPQLGARLVEIEFGKRRAVLQPGRGKATAEEDRTVRARYDGVEKTIKALCTDPKKAPVGAGPGGKPLARAIDLDGYVPEKTDGVPTKPTRVTSADELAKAIPNKGLYGRILKQVDFDKEDLIVFAWTGSNTDQLSFQIEETTTGPVAVFTFAPGRGEDVPHPRCRAYAVARNWQVVERAGK